MWIAMRILSSGVRSITNRSELRYSYWTPSTTLKLTLLPSKYILIAFVNRNEVLSSKNKHFLTFDKCESSLLYYCVLR